MKIGILRVSGKGSGGEREDRTGPAIREIMEAAGGEVVRTRIVPDEQGQIRANLVERCDEGMDLCRTARSACAKASRRSCRPWPTGSKSSRARLRSAQSLMAGDMSPAAIRLGPRTPGPA